MSTLVRPAEEPVMVRRHCREWMEPWLGVVRACVRAPLLLPACAGDGYNFGVCVHVCPRARCRVEK